MENQDGYNNRGYMRNIHINLSVNPDLFPKIGLPIEKYGGLKIDSAIVRGNLGNLEVSLLYSDGINAGTQRPAEKKAVWLLEEKEEIDKFLRFYKELILKGLGLTQ